jgi:hypothetical protein
MKTLVVTGYTDVKTRIAALANIAFLMARAGEHVCLMSTARNAFDLDLLLWDEDNAKVRTSRAIPGILDLIAEYQDTLLTSAWADADPPVSDLQACNYGTMRLRRPSSVLQTLEPAAEGDQPVHFLRGGPRRFSEEEPKEADDPRVDWPDFWANCAGAAFFEHIEGDLAKEHDWLLIDCDTVADRELVLLLSASAEVVLLLSDYSEGAKSEAYHLARDLRSSSEMRPAILAFPASVRLYDEMEILEKQRDHFDKYFAPFAPEGLERYWFVQAELPYVSYYMSRSLLLCRQHISRLHLPLYFAYQYVADTTRSVAVNALARAPGASLAERFADASRRARWDVFISYSTRNQEIAVQLREWLRKSELRAFLSQSDLTFEIGTRKWLDAINSVLERSGVLVLLATEEACQSEWVQHELKEFSKYDRLILPLRLGEHSLPKMLAEYQVLQWDGSTTSPIAMQEILRLILGGLARVRGRGATASASLAAQPSAAQPGVAGDAPKAARP